MIVDTLFIWSEAWAPLIPLGALIFCPKQSDYTKPVIVYLFLSFVFNTVSNIIWQRNALGLELAFTNNNPIYNLNSLCRFFLFILFFVMLKLPFLPLLKFMVPAIFVLFVVVDLFLWEDFMAKQIAHNIHAAEAGLLMISSLLYFYYVMRSDIDNVTQTAAFWIATGLLIFVAVSFPIYLYYNDILENYTRFTVNIWSVQKVGFIILCLLIAFGFYTSHKYKPAIHG